MIQQNFNLVKLNTLGVEVFAEYYFCLNDLAQLSELTGLPEPKFYLGGGSNVLFTTDYTGTIIHNALKGIDVLEEDDKSILIRAFAGEVWHDFVSYTLDKNLFGLERLAYIPGTVGATPVQNIGAYGIEAKEYIEAVNVYNIDEERYEQLSNEACQFAYRDSIFKRKEFERHLVISVDFRLSKKPAVYERFYPALAEYLTAEGIEAPTARDVFQAVIAVRRSKLPEVSDVGSAGSFFKNPIISVQHFQQLVLEFPNLISYPYHNDSVKLSAGQLIDLLGFKGKYSDNVGMYEKQALILVNLGGATGGALYQHCQKVMKAVHDQFGICLEPEVIIL